MIRKILRDAFRRYSDNIACHIDDRFMTFSELEKAADCTARRLRLSGTAPVLILSSHSVYELTAVIACIFAGIPYVPVNTLTPTRRLESIIHITGAKLLLADDKSFAKLSSLPSLSPYCINLKEFVNQMSAFDVSSADINPKAGCSNIIPDETPVNRIAYIIFTSGSTGEPKGVPISYDNLGYFARWIQTVSPLNSYHNINVLNQADLSFDLSAADLFYSLCSGNTWSAKSEAYLKLSQGSSCVFDKYHISVAVMTPSAAKLCLLEDDFNGIFLPALKCIYFCGERLEKKTVKKLWERFPDLKIINAYGPTEATSAVCAVTVSRPMLESSEELPVGDIRNSLTQISIDDSEIILKGATVFSGYLCCTLNQSEFYRTGDSGYIRDGLLYFTGRIDNQIKYKGYRIELDDIENNLNRIEGVRESAVIPVRSSEGTVKSIQAYCVIEQLEISPEYIRSALKNQLPEYMIPKTIRIVDALPLNINNKIDRKALC